MRRAAPRPVAAALAQFREGAQPVTVLARVQACWAQAVGPAIAEEAEPVGERDGTLTVACSSAVWAQELKLLGNDVVGRLNEALDGPGSSTLTGLRVRTARPGEGTSPGGVGRIL